MTASIRALVDEIAGYTRADYFITGLEWERDLRPRVAQRLVDGLVANPKTPYQRGLRLRLDEVARMARTNTTPQRFWITTDGYTLCDRHADFFLRSAIEQSPHADQHHTPRGRWIAVPAGQNLGCDTCITL